MLENTDLLIAIASAIFVMTLLTAFIIYFIILYRKKQKDFEWEREVFKQALLQTEIEIKEQTLSNISRELHDNLGQVASLIKINLNLVLPKITEKDKQIVTDSIDLTKHLIKDIRSLSVSLKGENLKRFGLIKMIEVDIERYQKMGGFEIDLNTDSGIESLAFEKEIFLYRMSQEIFNNILKHADATVVRLNISNNNGAISFHYYDNGKGFNTSINQSGSGLANLAERCKMIGAKLNISSKLGKGTEIEISLNTND